MLNDVQKNYISNLISKAVETLNNTYQSITTKKEDAAKNVKSILETIINSPSSDMLTIIVNSFPDTNSDTIFNEQVTLLARLVKPDTAIDTLITKKASLFIMSNEREQLGKPSRLLPSIP